MSINFINKRIPKIYQGSNLVYESTASGSNPQKTILIGNTNIVRIMQGNELVWGDDGRVVYGEGSTIIEDFAFEGAGLTGGIRIADSVTDIGYFAFAMNLLASVTIPDSVTNISEAAFASNQITSLVIPDTVTNIGGNAFYGNPLTEVSIGANTTYQPSSFPSRTVITVRD